MKNSTKAKLKLYENMQKITGRSSDLTVIQISSASKTRDYILVASGNRADINDYDGVEEGKTLFNFVFKNIPSEVFDELYERMKKFQETGKGIKKWRYPYGS